MSYIEKLRKMGSNAPSKSGDSSADFRHYLEKLFLWTILTQRLSQDVTIHYLNGRSPITQSTEKGSLEITDGPVYAQIPKLDVGRYFHIIFIYPK